MVKKNSTEKGKKEVKRPWVNSKFLKAKDEQRSERIANALFDNQNMEILKTEGGGYIETEGMEKTYQITQEKLVKEVDINTKQKVFSLTLDQFGPYTVRFDRPGRHLLLAGEKGHLAMMDALKQDLVCEFHTEERIYDVSFLHDWDMYAAAQTKYLHIYDSQGTELHCMRDIREPRFLQYLPYHYLLTSCNKTGWLTWLDISTGETINAKNTRNGTPTCFIQNPHNAIVFHGSTRGRISMWSPNEKDALVTMLCHKGPVLAGAIDLEGKYLITSGTDNRVKIWDLRTYEPLYDYKVPVPVNVMALSQRNLLALGMGGKIQIWNSIFEQKVSTPYMTESIAGHKLHSLDFRPFEDQMLIGLDDGIRSVVIPGAGEANLDTYELNPYETKKQRRERNVQKLLDKIQPELICLDPDNMF